ncbi:MAG: N-methyl-L-tryptophan oxidase, partial [Candidatus Poribacteria bacterium]|nr:N-methyl-L-tryptophan oxidase [Candidatus Poribacteria bacterium]
MASERYDAIVIGAGSMGSAAAYHLSKAGAKTLVIEQFSRGHTFGSSHGNTRIIRLVYHKPFYTELMESSYACWRDLERESGRKLLFTTGSVIIAPVGHEYVIATRASLDAAGVESEWLDEQGLASRLPQFRIEPHTMIALWQKDGGFLHASACISTQLDLAEQHGAEIRENTEVLSVDWESNSPVVVCKDGRYQGKKIVLAVGAWTGQLLPRLNLPLTVTRQQVVYFKPNEKTRFLPAHFPVFIDVTRPTSFYGVPDFGGKGVKVGVDGHGEEFATTPDSCSRTPDSAYVDFVHEFVGERMPDAAGEVSHAEVCLYTETPDKDFIIDLHPNCENLAIAGGFSGHGFKFGGLVGKI